MMSRAIELAEEAMERGEVPVGALVTGPDGVVIAEAFNRIEELKDPTAHAEILAIQLAAKALGSQRLVDCDLYVSLEPCTMCAGAISMARLRRLYFAASDPKGGGVEHGACFFDQSTCHHRPEVIGGLCESEASALLKEFFAKKRL